MRTTIILKDELIKRAMELSNISEKTAVIHAGLEALIERYTRQKLIALGGTDKGAKAPTRQRA